jgi:arylformamidase
LTFDARIASGAAVNVGRLDCSLHTGTHADAPYHVADGGATIDAVDPALYVGPARLVRLVDVDVISRRVLEDMGLGGTLPPRLLIATASPYDGVHFPLRVPALEPDAAAWLAAGGVRLVGVDQPSVDPLDSRAMAAHHALFEQGAGVLENLRLSGLQPGEYELVAAPLLVPGADAAPCRALVRRVAPDTGPHEDPGSLSEEG